MNTNTEKGGDREHHEKKEKNQYQSHRISRKVYNSYLQDTKQK